MSWLGRLKNADAPDTGATKTTKRVSVVSVAPPPSVSAKNSAIRDRLLVVARELGLPDALVLELPESELAATAEQSTWYADAEVRHRLLVFYLRSLAGLEPALPGSIAERDEADRQAQVQALRAGPPAARETP